MKFHYILAIIIASHLLTTPSLAAKNGASDQAENLPCIRLDVAIKEFPQQQLTQAEIDSILHMRSEEKFARDVYSLLYDQWKKPLFSSVPKKEQYHVEAIQQLLANNQLQDPYSTDKAGEFVLPEFNDLYQKVAEKGRKSLIDALQVAAETEEKGIVDYGKYQPQTVNTAANFLFRQLATSSRNNFRVFVNALKKEGVNYAPLTLSDKAFKAIMKLPKEVGMTYDSQGDLILLCGTL